MKMNISESLLKQTDNIKKIRLEDYKKLLNIIVEKTLDHISFKPSSKYILYPMPKYGRSKFFDEKECSQYVIERLEKRGLYCKYNETSKEFTISWDIELIQLTEKTKRNDIREEQIKPLANDKIRIKLDMSIPLHKLMYLNWKNRQKK